ncbi:MAG: hypothetical protein Q8Q63_01820 [Phaeovulum sp.]|uniref:hypothetical protein n=1 Tax=Phaeovulum sp. TaxID=2934796 RepID=UPI0027304BF3|nr:hypothetical protein [Phaeovulum sp.]MDP2063657.1 hypothetical protein [Phaeovulum sp.]MDP3860304.1 hypothetical protein [Phaeovulum sp.]
MCAAGYSGTPLPDKLGYRDGQAVAFATLPESLAYLATCRAFRSVEQVADWRALPPAARDAIHLFTTSAANLSEALPALRDGITPDGMIWISWPKKAAGIASDVSENLIRDRALADVLVDVKVCAVDAVWSGLKLVVRKLYRSNHINAGAAA